MKFSPRLKIISLALKLLVLATLAGPLESQGSMISKLEIMGGVYSLDATSSSGKGEASGFGSYRVGYRRSFLINLEGFASYSLFTSKITGGDLGYGPDVGWSYYPFSNAQPIEVQSGALDFYLSELWRPYVSLAFHQRQFQSVSSSYAGFGIAGGADVFYMKNIGLKAEVRYMTLQGPSEATANFLDILFGGILYY